MFETGLSDILRFFTQTSLAITGACSLWALIFTLRRLFAPLEQRAHLFSIIRLLATLLLISGAVFSILWWVLFIFIYPTEVVAHEGVVRSSLSSIQRGFSTNMAWVGLLTVIIPAGLLLKRRGFFERYGIIYFSVVFTLSSIVLALSSYAGSFGVEQLVLSLHNWHSIITLGTIVVVDYLFIATLKKDHLKKDLYTAFPLMSLFIWFGLSMEFVSTYLSFGSVVTSAQFFFNQTIVGIIIINGALLSGRINDLLIAGVNDSKTTPISGAMQNIIYISGALSIVSWLSITFLDFVRLPFSYLQFLFYYILLVALAFLVNIWLERVVEYRSSRRLDGIKPR